LGFWNFWVVTSPTGGRALLLDSLFFCFVAFFYFYYSFSFKPVTGIFIFSWIFFCWQILNGIYFLIFFKRTLLWVVVISDPPICGRKLLTYSKSNFIFVSFDYYLYSTFVFWVNHIQKHLLFLRNIIKI
jgi:hypothetical protein